MALEVTATAGIAYLDSEGTSQALQLLNQISNVATKRVTQLKMSVTTAQLAIPLGNVTSLGWAIFINRDLVNYLTILTGSAGKVVAQVPPGKSCGPIYLGSDMQAPWAQANTAACQMDYLICSQ